MKWHILGGGAIGLLWAYKLSLVGYDVTVIVRDPIVCQYLNRNGLWVAKEGVVHKVTSTLHFCTVEDVTHVSHLLLATKAYQAVEALADIAMMLAPSASIVLMQNGMGQHEQVACLYPQHRLYAAITTDGVFKRTVNELVWAGEGVTTVGVFSGVAETQRGKEILNHIPHVAFSDCIDHELWRKLAINAAINPLTALYDCTNGELMDQDEYHQQVVAICREAEQVAAAENQPLFKEGLYSHVCHVIQATHRNYSSMHQDIQHGRRTEIDYITGFLCRRAMLRGLHIPVNQAMYTALTSREGS